MQNCIASLLEGIRARLSPSSRATPTTSAPSSCPASPAPPPPLPPAREPSVVPDFLAGLEAAGWVASPARWPADRASSVSIRGLRVRGEEQGRRPRRGVLGLHLVAGAGSSCSSGTCSGAGRLRGTEAAARDGAGVRRAGRCAEQGA